MAKFALFLPFICAIALAATVPSQIDTVATTVPELQVVKATSAAENAVLLNEERAASLAAESPSTELTESTEPTEPISEDILTPDQWPIQFFKPLKPTVEEKPVAVHIPSFTPATPPTTFINDLKLSEFELSDEPVMGDQQFEYYSGSYEADGIDSAVLVKKAQPGFENLLYQEAQILQALASKNAFPQLVQYDGRNLTMTALCTSWAQYALVQFQSGGMDLGDAYDMMLQMLDALSDLQSVNIVHRDISPYNIAFGCYYYKDVPEMQSPIKLSESGTLYLYDFTTAENVVENNLNKYYKYAGTFDFASNATLHDEEAMFVQDAESLGYVLLYGLNGGYLTWSSVDGTIDLEDHIAKKNELDLDENLSRVEDDEDRAKAKRDIGNYFNILRKHTLYTPKEPLDYEALKACFNIMEQ